jgi:hypothetical protein
MSTTTSNQSKKTTKRSTSQAFNSPNIKVLSASYTQADPTCTPTGAPTNTSVDVMTKISAMCGKQSACSISIDPTTLGDPSPNCPKILKLGYNCGENKVRNNLTATDNSALNIACARGESFTSIGKDGRVYKRLPPCQYHGYMCKYYWNCRRTNSCPVIFTHIPMILTRG